MHTSTIVSAAVTCPHQTSALSSQISPVSYFSFDFLLSLHFITTLSNFDLVCLHDYSLVYHPHEFLVMHSICNT